jgi:hypothetical protein
MKTVSKQQGFALFLLAILLATATATVTVKALNHRSGYTQLARDQITVAALAQAKDALIGYAITYGDTHPGNVYGFLPCPDIDGTNFNKPAQGVPDPTCGTQNVSQIGRLPWRTLDLSLLRSGDGECLWYAVSGTYKNSPKTGLMNWDTNGQLRVYASDGTTLLTPADNQAVAVIFAPGTASPGQNRTPVTNTSTCGDNYTVSNYLDNDTVHRINNADIAAGKFIQSHEDRDANGNIILTVNDRIVFITKQDIWNAMQKRKHFLDTLDSMTQKVALCIADYGNKNALSGNHSLPWPAPLVLSNYATSISYNDHSGIYTGRLPNVIHDSNESTHNTMTGDLLMPALDSHGNPVDNYLNCPRENDAATLTELERLYPWWNNWKDHLFYAIGKNFKPDDNVTGACDSDHCLSVNGSPSNNAAVVIFAGSKLSNQTRANKSSVADYLEGRNSTNIGSSYSNGKENYQLDPTSTTFNDIIYCIKNDLTVIKGNPPPALACP